MTLTQSGDIREKIADQTLLHLENVEHVCYRADNESSLISIAICHDCIKLGYPVGRIHSQSYTSRYPLVQPYRQSSDFATKI